MRQGGLILAAGSVRSKTKKHEIINNSGAYKKKEKRNQHIFLAFSTPVAVSYNFFHVFPRRGALFNAASTGATCSWLGLCRDNERDQKGIVESYP